MYFTISLKCLYGTDFAVFSIEKIEIKFSLYYRWSKFIGDAWIPKTCNFTLSTLYFNYSVLKRFSANKFMSFNLQQKREYHIGSFIYFHNTAA